MGHVLAITTHAPVESVINYGLVMTGPRATVQECRGIDKVAMNPAARKFTGTGYTTRR